MRHYVIGLAIALAGTVAGAQDDTTQTLFTNVTVFDGVNEALISNANVLVEGNLIKTVSADPIPSDGATVIDGGGRTMIPGLIDAHYHLGYSQMSVPEFLDADVAMFTIKATLGGERALMRGFTSIRDMGGTPFSVKKAIDQGLVPGPRLYLSGPPISQTSGHFDARGYTAVPTSPGDDPFYWQRNAVLRVADGADEVLKATRENLRLGAVQIKLATGGGVSSFYDPLDVTEFTTEEIEAAVAAAADWNTYVAVHVMTDEATRRSVEAGVKSIEHGFLMTDETMQLMKDKGVWLSIQPLLNDEDAFDFPDPDRHAKWIQTTDGTGHAYNTAKELGVKTAFGTDIVWTPGLDVKQGKFLSKLKNWYSPYEALKMATSDNAELLAMSGPRNPYQAGPLGVIAEGAYADLILVDGNPLENLDLVADPDTNFDLIMKDGVVFKNTLE